MSNRYSFSGDTAFTNNGSMVWSDQVPVSDSTLTESINESYASAVEDNETQYLSVLETTNDITLETIHNLTLENSKMAIIEENLELGNITPIEGLDVSQGETNDQQVIVFSMDGSDDLYGIQFAQDDKGNMQKYQFKFRTTEDGQLEAIPESIQMLVNDIDTQEKYEEDETVFQETVENGRKEETNTKEFSGIRQTPVVEKLGDISSKKFVDQNAPEEQSDKVQMLIKGELEMLEYHKNDDNTKLYINNSMEEERVIVDEAEYGESGVEDEFNQHFEAENDVDIKTGILNENTTIVNIKQEHFQEDSQDTVNIVPSEDTSYEIYNHHHVDVKSFPFQNGSNENVTTEQDVEHHTDEDIGANEIVLEYDHYSPEEMTHVCEETDISDSENMGDAPHGNAHYEQIFIKENTFHKLSKEKQSQELQKEKDDCEAYYTEAGIENESDNDEYQIVEGLHVTGDLDQEYCCRPDQDCDTEFKEVPKKLAVLEHVNILKQSSLIKDMKETKIKNKTFIYYVIPRVEKENVDSLSVNYTCAGVTYRPFRSNPRSILKSSFSEAKDKLEIKALMDERFNKRFARSKEAVQARLFNNFISKTTIPHAPVRQTRLPRKQQIRPVDNRRDEEIIVQEVMIGSNGSIENLEEKLKNKDKLEITQYVILSDDSEEEYDPNKSNKRRKKHRKYKMSDMINVEDSDTSVIEIPSDDEESLKDQHKNFKRARGRPKKCTSDSIDSMKRMRGRPVKDDCIPCGLKESLKKTKSCFKPYEIETESMKNEFKCPHCIKTFPSQNSLSTHIHHHSLENSLRNRDKNTTIAEYRHKCEACLASFKNILLLNRHICPNEEKKTTKRLICAMCKNSFPDLSALNIHKRLHVKEHLFNSTSSLKVSPKKIIPRSSRKKSTFKCKECSRMCHSLESLTLHEKIHKKITCNSCGVGFPSKVVLDTHIRVNCVKSSSLVKNKRLSHKTRKSFSQSPKRKSQNFPTSSFTGTVLNNPLGLKLECEQCEEKFIMFQDLFKHQVQMHGLETPDKNILQEQKKRLHKPKTVHGGIPARDGMRKVFEEIRTKIAHMTPKKEMG